ncbi:pre-rRNA-processing protein TSR2 homolog isoform 2-T2 [Menidia menidia]
MHSGANKDGGGESILFGNVTLKLADLQPCEVEDFISELMDQEFDTVVEDGSLPQVALRLVQMFAQWQQGALQALTQAVQALTHSRTHRAKAVAPPTPSDEDSDTQMDCEAPGPSVSRTPPAAPPPQDEEDGWTVVRKKK